MEFDDEDGYQDNDIIAIQYVEVFKKYFSHVQILKIETIGDSNFSKILKLMMNDPSFPWFKSVHTIKCYQIRNLKDMNLIKEFFCRFKNLQTFKCIVEDEFNPLDKFIENGIRIPNISLTIPEKENLRSLALEFLKFNKTHHLKLYAGGLEKTEVTNLYLEHTKHLYLYDFASFTLTEVYKNLPDLESLHIQNVEDFNIENFHVVAQRLLSNQGL